MSSAAPAVKAAVHALVVTALASEPTVLVSYGQPAADGTPLPNDVVGVLGVEGTTEPGPMATTRPRDETLRVTVLVSSWRGGGPEVQQTVTERAYALLALVESAVRANPTLGGTVRTAAVVEHDLAEDIPPQGGRVAEISAVIESVTRI